MKVLVPVKRVVDYNVKAKKKQLDTVKPEDPGVDLRRG
jgi:electron transfer flavoprotein alpha/beta subunit